MPPADGGGPRNPLVGIGTVELVSDGFEFVEGPEWRAADGVLLFTDIPAEIIYELTPPSMIAPYRNMSGGANGLATYTDGSLLAAEHGGRRVSIETDGTVSAFVDEYMGMAFNSPNDIAVRSDGTVYFTDPPYGLAGRPREVPFNAVYRVEPDRTTIHVEVNEDPAVNPNGIVLSPDESVLYVAFTTEDEVRAYDVAADGSLSGERTFSDQTPGPDGMAMDEAANLYVTTGDGVIVIAPNGSPWGTIEVPMQPANCGFGDTDRQTLYITARTALYRVRIPIRGL